MEERNFEGLNYLISYPKGFSEDKKYPLVIFLHGAGTRCDTFEYLLKNGVLLDIKNRQRLERANVVTYSPYRNYKGASIY